MKKHILSLIACATFFASNPAFCMWNTNPGDDLKVCKRATGPLAQDAHEKQKQARNDQDFMQKALKGVRGPVGFEYYNLSKLSATKLSPSFIEDNQGIIRGFVDALTPLSVNLFNKKEVAHCVPMDPKKVQLIESNGTSYPPYSYAWCNIPKSGRYYIENFPSSVSKIGVKIMLSSADPTSTFSNPPIRLNFYDLLVHEKTSQTQSFTFPIGASSYTLQAYVVPDPELTPIHLRFATRVVTVPGQKIIFVLKDVPQKLVKQ